MREKSMDKYVRYCPLCDKYYPQNQMLCAFCFRDVILSPKWNSMSQQKKINWKFEHLPQVDISTLSEDSLKKMQDKANVFDAQYRAELEEKEHPKYTPKCPVCGSPDLRRISATSKVLDVAFWGFAAGKPKKTYHCNNCGYEF